MQREANPL
jgi:hypothetical protein